MGLLQPHGRHLGRHLEDALSAVADALDAARAEVRRTADPHTAPARKAYLKSPFEVLGCPIPALRRAARAVKKAAPTPAPFRLVAALKSCWRSEVHEDRLLAVLVAELYCDVFDARHVATLFKAWLRDSANWDFVDAISTYVVGHVALHHPGAWTEIEAWDRHQWIWLRRAAVLSHIPAIRARRLRTAQLRRTIHRLVDEKEFFIRKAIGWTLRELARQDPARSPQAPAAGARPRHPGGARVRQQRDWCIVLRIAET